MVEISDIIKTLESKQKDCASFSKKYEKRKVEDLKQYYDGAEWAITFALSLIKELDEEK
jgi:Na+/phosphate symporter|tara:strand:- start:176 stop:352 length:177 start_codon:yes stop_codon:yes gene_type:complete